MTTEKIDQTALNIVTKARTTLLIEQPFFGTLAMRLKLVQDSSIPTLNVDGVTMRYNPKFMKEQKSEIATSAMAHEVMHCVLEHVGSTGRGISLNPKKWNYAADYAVNDILKKSGFTLGDGWLWEAQYSGMTAEHIYSLIPTPPPGAGGGGNGGPQDEVLPGTPDPAMAAAQAADWQVATVQAANAAKAAGKLSEALDRFVDMMKENKVDWRLELRRFINTIAKGDYAWQRPNRKMLAAGFILPGLYSEEAGPMYLAADESGSVDIAITAAFGAEVQAIMQDIRPESTVLAHFDTKVRKVETFLPDDPFEMTRYCQGGTDFRHIFDPADDMQTPPMCGIVLTDLEGPFGEPPPFPVLWVSINKKVAPYGTTIHIEV